MGRGKSRFEEIIRPLNSINYDGPLFIEWEDSDMDRFHGAEEAATFDKEEQPKTEPHRPNIPAQHVEESPVNS